MDMNKEDIGTIINNCEVIINCAASIDFDLDLDLAIEINIEGALKI